ncbi:SH3 domain-containing protein [Christiangramia sabulilitoris]|uniref:Tetratricopeptide repeat protein n=1 Tax=Christiangramia sabulilitoris TaxID=2583991 RepID=A0A550I936_9FLAO|nr:tetratricopeptide repeat protein [Christiangramia sabulilitoris]TRO67479.1 tetratricopeptide repeat protein [Christiangramia sabulilitoris]
MRKLILICFLFISFSGFSQNDDIFEEANTAYQQGNYQEAVKGYEAILANGETSAELYFNLGNAHYKLNHVAPSIYYYEKALQLDPTDEDIQNNIEFARNMAIDDIESIEKTGFDQWLISFTSFFNYTTWAVMAIIFSICFVSLFLLYYFSGRPLYKRLFFGGAMLSALLSVLSVIFAFQQQDFIQDNQYAIIFKEEIEVRDEPNLRGEASYELHEGTKARVLEDYQEWSRIELANGAQGWVKSADIRML